MKQNEKTAFVKSSSEGIERVKNSNYAFISESTTIDYQAQRNCDLQQVGGLLDSKGYGIAFPKGETQIIRIICLSISFVWALTCIRLFMNLTFEIPGIYGLL